MTDQYEHIDHFKTIHHNDIGCFIEPLGKFEVYLKVSLSLDYILDDILGSLDKCKRDGIKTRTLQFMRFKTDNPTGIKIPLIMSNVLDNGYGPDERSWGFQHFGPPINIDLNAFTPFIGRSKRFFNYVQTNQLMRSNTSNFWNWTLEAQMNTFQFKFSSNPFACGTLLCMLMGRINPGCFGNVVQESKSYSFYKIQDHSLLIFAIQGADDFCTSEWNQIIQFMKSRSIVHVTIPKTQAIPKQLFASGWECEESSTVGLIHYYLSNVMIVDDSIKLIQK